MDETEIKMKEMHELMDEFLNKLAGTTIPPVIIWTRFDRVTRLMRKTFEDEPEITGNIPERILKSIETINGEM